MKKPFDAHFRHQIKMAIKNKQDLAELLSDWCIRGQDLSNSIISWLDVCGEDLTGTNFANCILGTKDTEIKLCGTNLTQSCFIGTYCEGQVSARGANLSHCNFRNAFMPYVDYRLADLSHSIFCNTVFSIGSDRAVGSKFTTDVFRTLTKHWGLVVLQQEEYDKLVRNQKSEVKYGI